MIKLLIKFLEPLERAVFNYMVRAGLIKPFIGALIGAGASLLGGAIQSRKAKKATRQAMAGIIY